MESKASKRRTPTHPPVIPFYKYDVSAYQYKIPAYQYVIMTYYFNTTSEFVKPK